MNTSRTLFVAQRYSAMLLAPFVLIHLLMIIIAVRNGFNEWTGLSVKLVDIVCLVLALLMLVTGLRAVLAVT